MNEKEDSSDLVKVNVTDYHKVDSPIQNLIFDFIIILSLWLKLNMKKELVKKVVVSGIQPSGFIHLGNYLGAV